MSRFQRFTPWFLTPAGKSFTFGSVFAGGAALVCAQIVPNTFLLDKYKEVVHLYKNGFAVPLPQQIKERFQKTLNLLEIPEKDKKQFKPFMVFGFDIFSAGPFSSRFGVIVGIPINFTYIDSDLIDKSGIRINEQTVQWELDEAKLLLKSLALSESAQMYAMAREIEMSKTHKYLINLFSSMVLYIGAYGLGNKLNIKYNLYARSRGLRLTMYALLGSLAVFNFIVINDLMQLYYEEKVDRYLKEKHQIFKEGGKEFYTNMLNRNIALRSLMGKLGESMYTRLGNENYLIRQKHLPLIQRRELFES